MMLRKIAATFALAPLFVHAQTSTDQQRVAALHAPKSPVTAAVRTIKPRISALVMPTRLNQIPINITQQQMLGHEHAYNQVAVSFVVSENGVPTDVQVVKSANSLLDSIVTDAVRQYRYSPATLNHQPIAYPMTINFKLQSQNLQQ